MINLTNEKIKASHDRRPEKNKGRLAMGSPTPSLSYSTFPSYVSTNKKSVGGSGTYKLALLQALSLKFVLKLCHRRVIHLATDMLARKHFSLLPTVFGPKYVPMAAGQSQ